MCVTGVTFLLPRVALCQSDGGLRGCVESCGGQLACYSQCYRNEGWLPPLSTTELIVYSSVLLLLIALSLLISSMMASTFSLKSRDIQLALDSPDPSVRWRATKVTLLRTRGNLLLVTFFVAGTATKAGISVILCDTLGLLLGFLAGSILILVFSEILPPVLSSHHSLFFAANTYWISQFLFVLFFPISYPLTFLVVRFSSHPENDKSSHMIRTEPFCPKIFGMRFLSQTREPQIFVSNPIAGNSNGNENENENTNGNRNRNGNGLFSDSDDDDDRLSSLSGHSARRNRGMSTETEMFQNDDHMEMGLGMALAGFGSSLSQSQSGVSQNLEMFSSEEQRKSKEFSQISSVKKIEQLKYAESFGNKGLEKGQAIPATWHNYVGPISLEDFVDFSKETESDSRYESREEENRREEEEVSDPKLQFGEGEREKARELVLETELGFVPDKGNGELRESGKQEKEREKEEEEEIEEGTANVTETEMVMHHRTVKDVNISNDSLKLNYETEKKSGGKIGVLNIPQTDEHPPSDSNTRYSRGHKRSQSNMEYFSNFSDRDSNFSEIRSPQSRSSAAFSPRKDESLWSSPEGGSAKSDSHRAGNRTPLGPRAMARMRNAGLIVNDLENIEAGKNSGNGSRAGSL